MALTPLRDATIAHNGKYSSRNGVKPKYIVIHHGAVTGNLAATMTGTRQVSAHVVMQDGKILAQVDEAHSSWTLGAQAFERACLTGETQNSTGAPSWRIAEAEYRNWARQVADWSERFAIPCNRTYVLGHGEVYSRHGYGYATACPGGIDVDRIVREANVLLAGSSVGGSVASAPVDTGWPYAWHTVVRGDTLSAIARKYHMSLSRLRRLNPSITDPTKLQIGAKVKIAVDQIPIIPKIDNIPGPETYGALEQAMGRTVDKRFGRDDVRALQRTMNKRRKVPVQVTGTLNDETMDALASWVAAPRSQVWAKVQKQLANGTGVWR